LIQNARQSVSDAFLAERNRLILQQLPYVRLIAQRIHARLPHHIQLEDLVNTGILGLIEALAKFDPRRKVELRSYASYRIRGAILDSLREQDWGSRVLRHRGRQLDKAQQQLRGRLGRTPSQPELARELGISEKGLNGLLNDLHSLSVTSLEGVETGRGAVPAEEPAAADDQSPFEQCRQSEMNRLLASAISRLSPRKQLMLNLYYFKGLKMKEVGAFLGVCESRISQIHTDVLASLRLRMKEQLHRRRRPSTQLGAIAQCRAMVDVSRDQSELKLVASNAAVRESRQLPPPRSRQPYRSAALPLASRRAVA
jgi:RNA polymerase sigma factor for flagellar operon FliA